jgi:hypothetical protein
MDDTSHYKYLVNPSKYQRRMIYLESKAVDSIDDLTEDEKLEFTYWQKRSDTIPDTIQGWSRVNYAILKFLGCYAPRNLGTFEEYKKSVMEKRSKIY